MAFNFAPKTSKEILKYNKKHSVEVAKLFDFLQKKYKAGITLDPSTDFKKVKVSRDLQRKNIKMDNLLREAKAAGVNTSSLNVDFGSGSADAKLAVGSAIETAKQETCSMLYIQYRVEKNAKPPMSKVLEIYPTVDDGWINTFEQQAIAVRDWLGSQSGYVYSRGDGMMGVVHKAARDFGYTSVDTWNPADIYMVKKTKEQEVAAHIKKISAIKDMGIDSLNDYMRVLLDKKILIPISLKRLANGQKSAHVELTNAKKTSSSKSTDKMFGIIQGSLTINLDINKDGTFVNKEGSFRLSVGEDYVPVQIRGFPGQGPRENVQVELTKFTGGARLGKAPAGVINMYFSKNGLNRLTGSQLPKQGDWAKERITFFADMYDQLSKHTFLGTRINWGTTVKSKKDFLAFMDKAIALESKDNSVANHFSNKLQAMDFFRNMKLLDQNNNLRDFLGVLFYGAKKEMSGAGPFIKVY